MRQISASPDHLDAIQMVSINDFCAAAGIDRSTLYRHAKAGRLKLVKLGRRSLIRLSEARRLLGVDDFQGAR